MAWPASLTVISGVKSHVAALKTKMLTLLIVMGEASQIDRQPLWVSQVHRTCALLVGLPAHSGAWAGKQLTPVLGGCPSCLRLCRLLADALCPSSPGGVGDWGTECLLLSTARICSARPWCLLPAGLWSAHHRSLGVSSPATFKGSGRVLNWGYRSS